jgi:Na+-transporting methylmalonyl-CoA/oxaloacetate decarboxylase gamma subunit
MGKSSNEIDGFLYMLGKINIQDIEKIIKSFRKHKARTVSIVILFLVFLAVIAYITSFSTEKGKQHADSPKESPAVTSPSKDVQQKTKDAKNQTITQHTKGNQSPAIISDGDVSISIENIKNEKK